VTGLLEERDRVCGVRTSNGDIRARLVVGADGVRSTVARLTGSCEYHRTDPGRMFVWGYFEDAAAPEDLLWFGKQGDFGYLASPTDAGLFMAVVAFSVGERDTVLADRPGAFRSGLEKWPELSAAVAGARRVGPLRTVADCHGYFRTSAGPGWVLVGDAGHFKDPTPGQGITDALRQVEHLAPAIVSGMSEGSLDAGLVEWWRWRDRDAWDMYWFARDLGAAGPTPLFLREVVRQLQTTGKIDRFFEVMDHARPASKLAPVSLALRAALNGVRRPDGDLGVLRQMLSFAREDARHRRMLRTTQDIYPKPPATPQSCASPTRGEAARASQQDARSAASRR
jgi:2-polyprenyl-6-methoxyphenol hydroxylase-like FAD-dependent oxidoreductase